MKKYFASDNYSGVHPAIMDVLNRVNVGHAFAYGMDEYTRHAEAEFKRVFGDVEVYFVFNGTGANVLSIEAGKGHGTSVICTDVAHIFQDETGAPSKITGVQLLPVKSVNGKLDVEGAKQYLSFKGTFHKCNPNMISITQSTEFGTIYTVDEIKEISKFARENGMYLHMDGARLSNAAVALGCTLRELTGDVGVDILSFGGIKNGLMFGEAIVIFNPALAKDFQSLRKQNLQLNSKMRYVSAQYIEYLSTELWKANATNSNNMAAYFAEQLKNAGIEVTNEVKGNTIFAILPKHIIHPLMEYCHFYIWDEKKNEVRLVTSFDTTKEDIDSFVSKLKELS